jgi:type II secretory pathway pseudopilin PulG
MQSNQTRAHKEGTPWWKIVGYVVGGFVLLIVIGILLFVFLLDSLAGNVQRTSDNNGVMDARQMTSMSQFKTALELYESDNGTYPSTLSALKGTDAMSTSSYPNSPEVYEYKSLNNGSSYCLGTCLSSPDANAETNQQCVAELNLSCDGAAMTKTPDSQ